MLTRGVAPRDLYLWLPGGTSQSAIFSNKQTQKMLIICQIDWREFGVAFELQCRRNCTLSSFTCEDGFMGEKWKLISRLMLYRLKRFSLTLIRALKRCKCTVHDFVICFSAGVMYWGDARLDRIETASIDGSGRRVLGTESGNAHYFAFQLHDDDIYITDWFSPWVYLFSPAAKPLCLWDSTVQVTQA